MVEDHASAVADHLCLAGRFPWGPDPQGWAGDQTRAGAHRLATATVCRLSRRRLPLLRAQAVVLSGCRAVGRTSGLRIPAFCC